jgi:glycosyltransferase involved in cell wall biosynthesis
MLTQVKLDPTRTHFMGRLPREQYLRVLQVSNAHVYLTYPFVLSWSLLEAMGCGAPIVASDTAPVREVMRDGENGRLVDFFDPDAIADAAINTMRSESANVSWRMQAMAVAQDYGMSLGLRGYDGLLGITSRTATAASGQYRLNLDEVFDEIQ